MLATTHYQSGQRCMVLKARHLTGLVGTVITVVADAPPRILAAGMRMGFSWVYECDSPAIRAEAERLNLPLVAFVHEHLAPIDEDRDPERQGQERANSERFPLMQ